MTVRSAQTRLAIAVLILLWSLALVWFIAQMLENGHWQYYSRSYRDLIAMCLETAAQDAGTVFWLLVMIWILPRGGKRKLMSPRRAVLVGAGVFAIIVIVRFASPFLYPGTWSIAVTLQRYARTSGGIAVILQLAGAIAAVAICAAPALRSRPHLNRSLGLLVLALVLIPPLFHAGTTFVYGRQNPWSGYTSTAQNCSAISSICWNIARCMPAIALAVVSWPRERSRESSPEI